MTHVKPVFIKITELTITRVTRVFIDITVVTMTHVKPVFIKITELTMTHVTCVFINITVVTMTHVKPVFIKITELTMTHVTRVFINITMGSGWAHFLATAEQLFISLYGSSAHVVLLM
jgi:hypothetical protein